MIEFYTTVLIAGTRPVVPSSPGFGRSKPRTMAPMTIAGIGTGSRFDATPRPTLT